MLVRVDYFAIHRPFVSDRRSLAYEKYRKVQEAVSVEVSPDSKRILRDSFVARTGHLPLLVGIQARAIGVVACSVIIHLKQWVSLLKRRHGSTLLLSEPQDRAPARVHRHRGSLSLRVRAGRGSRRADGDSL